MAAGLSLVANVRTDADRVMMMKFTPAHAIAFALGVPACVVAHAKVYESTEQAQQSMFPGVALAQKPFQPTDEQQKLMRSASSVSEPFKGNRIWKAANGGWFIVDEVVGKHEMITYAIGIGPDGKILQVAILEYHESYGYEVAEESWRKQFVGKTAASTLKLNRDIENISGATLSSKHITDGVRRVMTFYDAVLKNSE
jgi:Na+-translocating ferredoxin:NAD+ oxidoreductase RnfG subunit